MEDFGTKINFAYQTFQWTSEAKQKAAVYCVIIGFSNQDNDKKILFSTSNQANEVENINGYLVDADNIFIESRTKPISNVPIMGIGNKPIDGGFYLFNKKEMIDFIKKEPNSKKYFRQWYGSKEFINQDPRYCLWLGETTPKEIRSMPNALKRVELVREYRLASPSPGTRKIAETPTRFHVENIPDSDFLIVPSVSSEKRRYIPIGFMSKENLASNLVLIIPNASLFHFGILTSNVHMAWMRTVAGRLKSDYRYSAKIVYNNFPWPEVTDSQKEKISKTAQAILDARELYPDSSLADLYDELTMPKELRRAHQANDKAVMEAYGLTKIVDGKKTWLTESETVARLFEMYEQLTDSKS